MINELKDIVYDTFKDINEDQNLCCTLYHSVLDKFEEC